MSESSAQDQPAARRRPSFMRLLLVLAGCLLVSVGVHQIGAFNDNSTQNVVTLIAAAVAVLAVAVWFCRTLALWTPRSVALLITLGLLSIPIATLRIRGFTGEILPQLEYRFSNNRQLRSEVLGPDQAGQSSFAVETPFPQFLGPDRNAVIARREFAVPDATLQPLWKQAVGDGWASFAIFDDRCVTLEQRSQEEWVSCYRLADGVLLWASKSPGIHRDRFGGIGPRSTPTIADGRVYTQGATGTVQCLDLASGQLIWQQDLIDLALWSHKESEDRIQWGRAGSPLLAGGLCVLPFGGPLGSTAGTAGGQSDRPAGRTLIALDAADGSVRWTAGDDQIAYASPMLLTLAGTEQIVIVNENSVTGHAVADGRQLWSFPWPGSSRGAANCAAPLQVDADAILVGKAYGVGSAVLEIAQVDGEFAVTERWQRAGVLKTKFTHACIAGGMAYALSDGTLECVDLADGRRRWAQPRGARYGHGQMILVEDVLVIQTEAGEVAFVAARDDKFEELAVLPALSSKTWNIPSVAGRLLAVRNDTEAILYELPPRTDASDASEESQPSGADEVALRSTVHARQQLNPPAAESATLVLPAAASGI